MIDLTFVKPSEIDPRDISLNYEEILLESGVNGSSWYRKAYDICHEMAVFYNVPVKKVAAIMAVMSPSQPWRNNITAVEKILDLWSRGLTHQYRTIPGFHRGKNKAYDILSRDDFEHLITGEKVKSFYLNIVGNEEAATIDRHMIASGLGLSDPMSDSALSAMAYHYDKFVQALIIVSDKYDIPVPEIQAIVWEHYRSKYRARYAQD